MKNLFKVLEAMRNIAIIALVAVIGFSFAACGDGSGNGDGGGDNGSTSLSEPPNPFTSIASMKAWLDSAPANTAATAYTIQLNVSDLGVDSYAVGSALKTNDTKYVNLDLSGSSITSIEENAFFFCEKLTNVTIPNSVTSIGEMAFAGCFSLTDVTIGSGVTSIGVSAFISCHGLTSVTIPDSVTSIGQQAFSYCEKLTGVTIGSGVTSIGFYAFSGCTSLTSVSIPSGVTSIGGQAFVNCTSLTAITVDAGNTAYSSEDGVVYNKAKTTIVMYPAGKPGAFTIPSTVTSIEVQAFLSCTKLTSVTIGSGVTSIGGMAFSLCTSLTAITVDTGNTAYSSDSGVLYNKAKTTLMQYPQAKMGSTFTIPDGVTSIGDYALLGCTSLTSVTISNTVTSIGRQTFSSCSSLTSVRFEKAGTTLGTDAFIDSGNTASLQTAYTTGGVGTYTRPNTTSSTWTKKSS